MKKRSPKHHRKTIDNAKGFTIIEVLIAMFILAIGILATTKMQLTAIKANHDAMNFTRAAIIAQDQIEILMLTPFDDNDLIDDGDDDTKITDEKDGYSIAWNVDDVDADGDGTIDFKQINLQVNDPLNKNRANINFIRSNKIGLLTMPD